MKIRRCFMCSARKPLKSLTPIEGEEDVRACRNIRACDARAAHNDVAFFRRLLGYQIPGNRAHIRAALNTCKIRERFV